MGCRRGGLGAVFLFLRASAVSLFSLVGVAQCGVSSFLPLAGQGWGVFRGCFKMAIVLGRSDMFLLGFRFVLVYS